MLLNKEIEKFQNNLINTNLFEWINEDDGRIIALKGTRYRVIFKDLWIAYDSQKEYYQVYSKFEDILDSVDEELQKDLLFHLDLFI